MVKQILLASSLILSFNGFALAATKAEQARIDKARAEKARADRARAERLRAEKARAEQAARDAAIAKENAKPLEGFKIMLGGTLGVGIGSGAPRDADPLNNPPSGLNLGLKTGIAYFSTAAGGSTVGLEANSTIGVRNIDFANAYTPQYSFNFDFLQLFQAGEYAKVGYTVGAGVTVRNSNVGNGITTTAGTTTTNNTPYTILPTLKVGVAALANNHQKFSLDWISYLQQNSGSPYSADIMLTYAYYFGK
ncbi:hypothetical protein BKH43_03200 [Helicobacter sp. 13S00401-1]|uniref:hypothetical protein n=1 Tax=Helicobacter sp. 13S00401-1 TaxID=1905758 RepID=UPI000BA5594B|nr:hypothetical protein [Helicobacter sp. 13S00401-1]PAF50882.1 hypothetical protein BKH43_03200 [Helicobacter sp. 13S00401-1]